MFVISKCSVCKNWMVRLSNPVKVLAALPLKAAICIFWPTVNPDVSPTGITAFAPAVATPVVETLNVSSKKLLMRPA